MGRLLSIDGPIQSKANIPESTERGNTLMNTYRVEMRHSEYVQRCCNVVAETAAIAEMVARYNPGYRIVQSRLLYKGGRWICAGGR
jgi:hypothetical protein